MNRNLDNNKTQEFRTVYANVLGELLEEDDKVVLLDADLAGAVNTSKLFDEYPSRTINVGVSEANMVGVAAGISSVGFTPYIHTFAPFASRRVLDQIFMSLAYSKNNAHIYGSDPGLYAQYNGGTHTTFEDLSVLRAISGITITAPADGHAFAWVLKHYQKNKGVYYTRAPRGKFMDVYQNESEFKFGKGNIVKEGKDIAIIALGTMVQDSLAAAKILEEKGISVEVIDLFFVKPYDKDLIQQTIQKFNKIVTVENHNKYGGISDIVAKEIVFSKKIVELNVVAINDRFGEIGNIDYLKKAYGISVEDIINKIEEII